MASKLDIFAVLSYLDENNLEVHTALREDAEMLAELDRSVSWILPQWMTGAVNDETHAELMKNFNSLCNDGWFSLYGHPELQTKLLACCGLGRKVRHKFFKPAKSRNLTRMMELLSHKYQDIREEEVELWCRRNDKAGMSRLAESLGYQKDKVKELAKAFDVLRKG